MILNQTFPSRLLHIIGPGRWPTLNDNTVLLLRFSQVSEKFRLQMGDIAIKLLKLIRKCICLGLVMGTVIKDQRWHGGPVCCARQKREIWWDDRLGVRGNEIHRSVVARWLWHRFSHLGCKEGHSIVLSWIKSWRCWDVSRLCLRASAGCWGARSPLETWTTPQLVVWQHYGNRPLLSLLATKFMKVLSYCKIQHIPSYFTYKSMVWQQ